jgi:DNA-binding NarL/FixJ family response regulator
LEQRSPIRVVVGEDQALFREGVVHVLRASGFDVVAATADARDIVRKARAHSPDVAVVDIQMPPGFGDDGLRAAREIHEIEPAIGVLVLSQFLEESYAADLLGDRPEGIGYLLKDRVADAGSFAEAVRRVARGGSVIDPDVIRCLVGRRRTRDPLDELTRREGEVLELMGQGRSNQGVADAMVVTVSAVERHVTSIFVKLGLDNEACDHRRVLAVLQYLRHRSSAGPGLPDGRLLRPSR